MKTEVFKLLKINEKELTFAPITREDLNKLSILYEDLTGRNSNINKMHTIFPVIESNNDYYLYKVEHKGILVGTIMGIICHEICAECEPFLVVEDVVVRKDYRRKHIGKFMFEQIEKIAKERGCYISILVSSYRHPEAHIFYEEIGFTDPVKGFRKKL